MLSSLIVHSSEVYFPYIIDGGVCIASDPKYKEFTKRDLFFYVVPNCCYLNILICWTTSNMSSNAITWCTTGTKYLWHGAHYLESDMVHII